MKNPQRYRDTNKNQLLNVSTADIPRNPRTPLPHEIMNLAKSSSITDSQNLTVRKIRVIEHCPAGGGDSK